MSNYTILQENTMYGLSETASSLYLKLLDVLQGYGNRINERKAFLAACHYDDKCGDVLDYILNNSPQKISAKVKSELRPAIWQLNTTTMENEMTESDEIKIRITDMVNYDDVIVQLTTGISGDNGLGFYSSNGVVQLDKAGTEALIEFAQEHLDKLS